MDLLEQYLSASAPRPGSGDPGHTWLTVRTMLYRYALVLKRRWWVPFLTTAIGLALGGWFASQLPPSFLSQARMMVSGKMNIQDGIVYSEELSNFFGTQMELMRSGEVQKKALDRVEAAQPDLQAMPVSLTVGQQPKTSLFLLGAVSTSGPYARAYLDAVMEEYIAVKQSMRSQKSETTYKALSGELKNIEDQLKGAREQMLRYQAENNLGYLKEAGNSAAISLSNIDRQLEQLGYEYDVLESLSLDQALDRDPSVAPGAPGTSQEKALANFGPMTDYLKAKQQLQLLQADHDQLAQVMRPKHPDMVRLDQEIEKTTRMIETFRKQSIEQIRSRREALKLQMETLRKAAEEKKTSATDMSRKLAEFERLRANVDSLQAVADRLSSNLRNVDVSKAVDQDVISILDHASPPRSIRPGLVKLLAIGFGIGLFLGLVVLFLLERIDDRLSSLHDVQSHFQERILGHIVHEGSGHEGMLLLQVNDVRHSFAECFRSLRSSLVFLPQERKPQTILVTSALPGEGKSTTASNLAIAFAIAGARTLLVDADLRRGTMHQKFKISNRFGLAEVLKQEVPWAEAVVPSPWENLSIVPRGSVIQQPGEYLLSSTATRFIQEARAAYDYVIIDSAPVMVAEDTSGIVSKVDAIVVVLRFAMSSVRLSHRAIARVKERQGHVAGLVLNEISSSMPEYGDYYLGQDYYGEQPAPPSAPVAAAKGGSEPR